MRPSSPMGPVAWMERYCPSLDGQFVFLDPLWWDTHLLSAGAVTVLREAAAAIEDGSFDSFQTDIHAAGGWPAGLERLARALASLADDAAAPMESS